MSDISQGEQTPDIPEVVVPQGTPDSINFSDAARILQSARRKDRAPLTEQPVEAPAEAAAPEPELPLEEGTAPATEQPSGEQAEAPEPAPEPPIEPPSFWSKDAKERWSNLPRETQEYIAEREQARDREVRRTQNETAEKLKSMTAREQVAEQRQQQYEATLPQLIQSLQNQGGEFANIQTWPDVEKMQAEDPFKYQRWQLHQQKMGALEHEHRLVQERQAHERLQKFTEFAQREDNLFTEKAPEMADPEKAAKLQSSAVNVLKDIGFTPEELAASWQGQRDISLRDHRMQLLIRDAMSWREAQTKVRAAVAKPVPPVQRPGVAPDRTAGREAEIQNLSRQLDSATSGLQQTRIAAQLLAARRANRR